MLGSLLGKHCLRDYRYLHCYFRRLVFISGGITHAPFGGIGLGLFAGISPHTLSRRLLCIVSIRCRVAEPAERYAQEDSAIAVFWTLGMALGIMFSFLSPGFAPDLSAYLFGNILTINQADLWMLGILALILTGFFLSVYPSYRIYRIRPRVCPFTKDSGRDIRICADDVYCVDHRRLSAYGRHRSRNIATHHSAMTANLFTYSFKKIIWLSIGIGFLGCSWSVYFLPLESPFGRFDYILLYPDLCRLQDRKELLQETVIIIE